MVLLWETWQRYGIPIAVTEAHLGCTREEQMRWLDEVWQAAKTLRGNGVDVRAVTAWSLLGAYDWHCLLTRCEGHYEPGVFDLRGHANRARQPWPRRLTHYGHGKPFDHRALGLAWLGRHRGASFISRWRAIGPQIRDAAIPLQPRMRRPPLRTVF
jgi:dTDP-4-dehydrorhamnose reductase